MNIAKVQDSNVYLNDGSTHGQASEVTCPTITAMMSDYNALGMAGSVEFFNGFDKMEATIKWKYPSNEVKKACADFTKSVDIMVRSSKAVYDDGGISEEVPIAIYLKGMPKQHVGGTFKKNEDTELDSAFAISYYKEEVDGEAIVELDVLNNIYKVNGEDILAKRRENMGT